MRLFVRVLGDDSSCVLAGGRCELRRLPDLHGARAVLPLLQDAHEEWALLLVLPLKIPAIQVIFVRSFLYSITHLHSSRTDAAKASLQICAEAYDSMPAVERSYWRALLFGSRFHHGPSKFVAALERAETKRRKPMDVVRYLAENTNISVILTEIRAAAAQETGALQSGDFAALTAAQSLFQPLHDRLVDELYDIPTYGDYHLAYSCSRPLLVHGAIGKSVSAQTRPSTNQATDPGSRTVEGRAVEKVLGPLEHARDIEKVVSAKDMTVTAAAARELQHTPTVLTYNIALCFLFSASKAIVQQRGEKAVDWISDENNLSRLRSLTSLGTSEKKPVFSLPLALEVMNVGTELKRNIGDLRTLQGPAEAYCGDGLLEAVRAKFTVALAAQGGE